MSRSSRLGHKLLSVRLSVRLTAHILLVVKILILLTGFSRNYLGVHTPQDVLVGLTEGALMLWGVSAVFKYIANHPEKEN